MAVRCLGIGPGDEVIVPDYTYPATAEAVMIAGAKAVVVDVDADTMLINFDALEAAVTPRTKAVMPVSLFGNPLDYDRLLALNKKHGFAIIEDAACSIGASFRGRKVGSWSDISVFSLHPRKFITTGEGGVITTNNAKWAEWMVSYKHFGIGVASARETTQFTMVGTNYKLSNLQAAVGVVQMRDVDVLLARRRELAARYCRKLSGVELPVTTPGGEHSWQSFCVQVNERDRVMKALRGEGIEAQIGTYSLHMQPAFRNDARCELRGPFDGSRRAYEHCLALPLFHDMTESEQDRVVERLKILV